MPYIFRKLYSGATFASEIVCVYLEPSKSYKSSDLMLKKYAKCNNFGLMVTFLEIYRLGP